MNKNERVQQIVQELNIIDDTFFQKMAEDIEFCEEMLSTFLNRKVIVKGITPQNSIKNLQGRSVILDALCEFETGEECNIEVQKANDDDHQKRVRYNTSCITANIMEPGSKFEQVPNVIGIFISKFDIFQAGKTIYHIDRVVRETGEKQDNGLQEIYINTKINDGSDVAELMRIFTEPKAYNFEKFPKVSGRKKQFKENQGGQEKMCDLVENYARECAEEAVKVATEKVTKKVAKETAENLFKNGAPYELVRKSITELTDDELKAVYEKARQTGIK